MIIQELDFLLNESELFDLAAHLQPERSRLAVLPPQAPASPSTVVQEYGQLPEDRRNVLNAIVQGLAYPVRVMRLHYSIADETISRQLILWPRAGEELVTLVGNGTIWRLSTNTEFGVRTLIKEVLAAGSSLRRDPLCLSLPSTSVLVLLGILEQMRYVRLYATLMGQTPIDLFATGDVLTRMRESTKEDFRWPLAMFEKVLPIKMMESVQLEDVTAALAELARLELVEACDENGLVYELTPAGVALADGVLHEVSKAALCVSQYRSDGILGHDAALLVRSSLYLFLFELAGEAGVLATLDDEGTDLFLAKTMETPELETVSAAASLPGPGQTISAAQSVTPRRQPIESAPYAAQPTMVAGARASVPHLAGVCPRCGNPAKPGAKFCRNCGARL